MPSLHAINLRFWVPVILLMSILLLQGISLKASYTKNRDELVERALSDARRTSEQLRNISAQLSAGLDLDTIRDIYSTYLLDPHVRRLLLVNQDGEVLFANRIAWEGRYLDSILPEDISLQRTEEAIQGKTWIDSTNQKLHVQVYRQVELGTEAGSLRKVRFGALILDYDYQADFQQSMKAVWWSSIIELGLWMLVTMFLLWLIQRFTVRPVRALAEVTQMIAEKNFSRDLNVSGSGEIARLAQNFNRMTQSLQVAWTERDERERFLQTTLLSIGDAVIVTDPSGLVMKLNPVAEQLTGWSADKARGRPLQEVFHIVNAKDRLDAENPVDRVLREGAVTGLANQTILIGRDGSEFQIADSAAPIRLDAESPLLGVILVFRDVTDEYRLQDEAKSHLDRLRAITQALPDLGFVIDEDGRYIEVLGDSPELIAVSQDELLNCRVKEYLPEPVASQVMVVIAKTLREEKSQRLEYALEVKAGNRYFDGRTAPLHTLINGKRAVVWVATDITERHEALEQIKRQAYFDELTGLLGRSAIRIRLQQEVARAVRHEIYNALLYFDLDHFKDINDSLGHDVGDEIIKVVAERVSFLVRTEDVVARLGGDEFVVLLTDLSDDVEVAAIQAQSVAEKIKKAIAEPIRQEEHFINLTASIGITLFPQDRVATVADLLKQGDTAMYRAKSEGRNRVRFFTLKDQEEANRRFELVHALPTALLHDQLSLHIQPIVDREGRCVAAEALMRWEHPELGWISPNEFIPIAEQSGLILDLGAWTMERACIIMKKILAANGKHVFQRLSVNLSPAQFQQADFGERVMAILHTYQIEPEYIGMELTEEILVARPKQVREVIDFLRAKGIHFSIDDFGTGYSSLQYLSQLPLDSLKIDRSFIRDIATDPQDAMIVETVIQLARSMQLNVIAEGVEDKDQLEFLMRQGCGNFQGYHFARPMPVDAFLEYLQQQSGA
jgi:diguanylate cyclase (GGDEF)-like protein/PAS domain S-box-containing protein